VAGINPAQILYTHRLDGDTDIYFLSNSNGINPAQLTPAFSASAAKWRAVASRYGQMERLAGETGEGVTRVSLRLESRGSVFVVFRPSANGVESVVSFMRNDQPVMPVLPRQPAIKIQKADYGVPADASRTRDVRSQVQAMVNGGESEFQIGKLNEGGGPSLRRREEFGGVLYGGRTAVHSPRAGA